MTTPTQPQKRVRINVETSVKGVKTWSCTVEYYDCPTGVDGAASLPPDNVCENIASLRIIALAESDALVAELDRRYPKEV